MIDLLLSVALSIGDPEKVALYSRGRSARQTTTLVPPERTTMLDNATVNSARLRFAAGSGEAVHSPPNDLVTVQLTPGEVRILVDGKRTNARRPAGFVQFLSRNTLHSYKSPDRVDVKMLSVSIK